MDANTGLIGDKVAAERSQEEAAVVPRAIENHGVIGDLATIALVATDGTLDFLCWPDFDSPTIFAALLDPERGGMFQIAPELSDARVTQQYLPDTNVLLTRWMGDKASGELTDFMYVKNSRSDGSSMVVRRFRATRGSLKVRMSCTPRFEYATRQLSAELEEGAVIWRQANGEVLRLLANVPLAEIDGTVVAEITLQAGEGIDFILDDGDAAEATPEEMEDQTVAFWQNWARQSTYRGRWREMVNRSALALKLMTSRKHGSIVAAATFGLPETPGGSRNWDYRATWIRDASFTVYALMRLGYRDEAMAFNDWIGERASACDAGGRLKVMYAIDGGEVADEISLEHLRGYGGATPVRVGNRAAEQFQLDIYGELLDSIYLSNKYGHAISHDHWEGVRKVVEFVCDHWEDPDAGIWEMRRERQEFLRSRLMCWVAVDRGIRLATKRSLAAPFSKWHDVRNDIYEDIWKNFWNEEKRHFVQTKGGDTLDASLLSVPRTRGGCRR
nr:glycoside hydrolase family 15 protein [Rhizobium ruizarguesonis]